MERYQIRGGVFIDAYNQTINEDITGTIITRVNTCNHYYVTEPQVLTPKRTDFGKSIRKQYEKGEIDMSRHEMTTMEPRTDGITNTLTSVQKEGVSPCITSACGAGGGMTPMLTDADLETPKSKEFIEQERGHEEMRYRIRKLTPRECFRLQGVDDKDIDTLQNASISNSQLYKLAGNSITVDVLYHILRKAFIDTSNEHQQQTLF